MVSKNSLRYVASMHACMYRSSIYSWDGRISYIVIQDTLFSWGRLLRGFKVSFVLLIGIFILALSLHSVRADSFGLIVQDTEIVPAVAKVGELVNVNVTIKNVGKNTTSCNVTTFCGDCVVGIRETFTVASQASVPLSFKLETSNLSTGNYSIEALIKKSSGEQKIFDLGNLTIEQDAPTIPEEVTEPQPGSTNPETTPAATIVHSDWQHVLLLVVLLLVVPAGAISSMLVMVKPRNGSQTPAECTPEMKKLEKEFEKQFGFGKAKVCLIICAVLGLILAISSLWLFT